MAKKCAPYILLLTALAEAVGLSIALWSGASALTLTVTVHVCISLLAVVVLGHELTLEKRRISVIAAAALIAAAGLAGLTVALLARLASICAGNRSDELAWLLSPAECCSNENGELVRRLIRLGVGRGNTREFPSVPIRPFFDMVRWGSLAEKQRVLGQIGKHFDGSLLPALQRALSDPDNLIRVQAASTMVAIEARLAENISRSQSRVLKNPSDLEALKKSTTARIDRLSSGLVDVNEARNETEECTTVMLDLYHLGVLAPDEVSSLARLLIECGRLREARKVVRELRFDPREHVSANEQILVATRRFSTLMRYRSLRASYENSALA